MRHLFPAPWVSFGLLAGWMLLTRSMSIGQFLLGLVAAIVIPILAAPLRPRPGPLRRWGRLVRLIFKVGGDVIRSALWVARGIVRSRERPPRGTFVAVPLDLHDVHGLAALAMITAVIPGTVWSELAADRSTLLIHVFDLDDEAGFIRHFKTDYELPLKEIFE